jgi:hypothetical protein
MDTHTEDITASLMNRKLWRKGFNLTAKTPSSYFISLKIFICRREASE